VYVKNWEKDGWRALSYQYVWTIVCRYIRFNLKTEFCIPFGDTMSAVNITLAGIQELGCHLGPRPAQILAPFYLQDPTNIR
jgi:hypothetical protein